MSRDAACRSGGGRPRREGGLDREQGLGRPRGRLDSGGCGLGDGWRGGRGQARSRGRPRRTGRDQRAAQDVGRPRRRRRRGREGLRRRRGRRRNRRGRASRRGAVRSETFGSGPRANSAWDGILPRGWNGRMGCRHVGRQHRDLLRPFRWPATLAETSTVMGRSNCARSADRRGLGRRRWRGWPAPACRAGPGSRCPRQ